MLVDGARVFDGDVQMALVKSGPTSRELFPSLHDYDGALNELKAWRTE